jgi:hypothetical protein
MGGGVVATGCFFAAQPARSRYNTSQAFFILFVFALPCPLVDGNLGYTGLAQLRLCLFHYRNRLPQLCLFCKSLP